jgi:glycosyltransferase involved in cell wall biosynthesis
MPTSSKLSSLTIFFPFYNDEGTVEEAISLAFKYGKQVAKSLEVIALHGGNSKDNTWQRIQAARKKYPQLRVINKKTNTEGYAVIKHGFSAATKEWIFYTDGDLQYNVSDLPKLVKKHFTTGADIVNGYKTNREDHFFRQLGGEIYRQLSKWIFHLPIRDVDCDFRLLRTSKVKKLHFQMSGASLLTELIHTLQQQGSTFAELPVRHRKRRYGSSNYTTFSLIKEKVWGDLQVWVYFHSLRTK